MTNLIEQLIAFCANKDGINDRNKTCKTCIGQFSFNKRQVCLLLQKTSLLGLAHPPHQTLEIPRFSTIKSAKI